ncbi:50S ribosome-binding GTPase-like protein 1 [Leptotrombidium deliense]|uniref:50S ribosome-binding GTPase-like protein 1 n=1 Tax=Leptotrombidium deliense TaxID=299467 RepID=A0A443SSF8_9ACAR|nr:50S ribosome-binding GTPase-like protein 1 [Leptotrombidium deliense]
MLGNKVFKNRVRVRYFLCQRFVRGVRPCVSDEVTKNELDDKTHTEMLENLLREQQRLSAASDWRKKEELRFARRLLPVPVSLTGFGDGDEPKVWRSHLINALIKLENEPKENLCLSDKLSPSLKLLFDNHSSEIEEDYRKLYEVYKQEKKLARKNEDFVYKKNISKTQLPFNIVDDVKRSKNVTQKKQTFKSGVLDEEYNTFLKHHHLLQHFASKLTKGVTSEEYEAEIEAWRDEMWRRNYGTPNPEIKPSNVPCGGCGAHLHCVDRSIPGYIPSEKYTSLNEKELLSELCQRCEYIRHFNVALNVNVSSEQYPQIISEIKNKFALVILMVDLLDFPCSIWPKILDLIGENRKIYVVGNKVDLLPKDSDGYLERIEESLRQTLHVMKAEKNVRIKHLCLISAKTGFGVDSLVTKLLEDWNGKGDIILIGCTNVGKSTLFNALMQSDLCKVRENDLIQRATTSLWPGTTLNLLKFPIQRMEGWQLKLRQEKLIFTERIKANESILERSLRRQTHNPGHLVLSDRVAMTLRENIPINVDSSHPFAQKSSSRKPFNANDKAFTNCHFFHDTPGAVYKEQLLTLLTTEELLRTIPREVITPRSFSVRPFQTLFVGGIGRIDVLHAKDSLLLTVFASNYLPIHVLNTEQARSFYETYVGSEMLAVPIAGGNRLEQWPPLLPMEIDLEGIGYSKSCADIVLSSVGWVSVTLLQGSECVLKAYTPQGRGLYVRRPSVLPFAVKLKGKKIRGTPCFETSKPNVELEENDYKYRRSFHRL